MTKKELLEKLQAIDEQNLSASISVKELIPLIEEMEGGKDAPSYNKEELVTAIVSTIRDLDSSDILYDYELDMNDRTVELSDITLDEGVLENAVTQVLDEFLED